MNQYPAPPPPPPMRRPWPAGLQFRQPWQPAPPPDPDPARRYRPAPLGERRTRTFALLAVVVSAAMLLPVAVAALTGHGPRTHDGIGDAMEANLLSAGDWELDLSSLDGRCTAPVEQPVLGAVHADCGGVGLDVVVMTNVEDPGHATRRAMRAVTMSDPGDLHVEDVTPQVVRNRPQLRSQTGAVVETEPAVLRAEGDRGDAGVPGLPGEERPGDRPGGVLDARLPRQVGGSHGGAAGGGSGVTMARSYLSPDRSTMYAFQVTVPLTGTGVPGAVGALRGSLDGLLGELSVAGDGGRS